MINTFTLSQANFDAGVYLTHTSHKDCDSSHEHVCNTDLKVVLFEMVFDVAPVHGVRESLPVPTVLFPVSNGTPSSSWPVVIAGTSQQLHQSQQPALPRH